MNNALTLLSDTACYTFKALSEHADALGFLKWTDRDLLAAALDLTTSTIDGHLRELKKLRLVQAADDDLWIAKYEAKIDAIHGDGTYEEIVSVKAWAHYQRIRARSLWNQSPWTDPDEQVVWCYSALQERADVLACFQNAPGAKAFNVAGAFGFAEMRQTIEDLSLNGRAYVRLGGGGVQSLILTDDADAVAFAARHSLQPVKAA